ncbi:YveK family protein [Brevibacillus massiliensis]|jgi:capsular polysaccharide biosynthesis protein|uniref:YveK family protein n=1 Tax=Brevibacillus massiliensis TaxID=1118054 RepID=UPI0003674945|nr:Wzz/FepE/Etk N-terminal domain-containing protein [Brevibacillus massiliensis]
MDNIQITDVRKIIRQRLALILIISIGSVAVCGWLSFFLLKPEYEASTSLLIQTHSANQDADTLLNDVRANQELVKTYSSIIKSRRIAEDVIRSLHLNLSTELLLRHVQVEESDQSLVTTITVTDSDPAMAASIANEFAQSFQRNLGSMMKVDNISILDEAKVEGNPLPVRPKPYLNMGIGLVLGLLISVGLAFLLEYFDKTIKEEEQIEEFLLIPVLGTITDFQENRKKQKKRIRQAGEDTIEISEDTKQVNLSR